MAGPWEQYAMQPGPDDAPAAKPWERYAAPAPAPAAAPKPPRQAVAGTGFMAAPSEADLAPYLSNPVPETGAPSAPLPIPPDDPARPRTGLGANIAAGLQDGVAGIINAASDPYAYLIAKPAVAIGTGVYNLGARALGKEPIQPQLMDALLENPPGPGDRLMAGLNRMAGVPTPAEITSATGQERYARALVGGATGMAATGPMSSIRQALATGAIGGAAGMGGQAASDMAPDDLKPLAGLVGSGGTGAAAAGAVGRIVQPVRNQLNPEAQRLAQVAAVEGIPLTAAQQTGSKPLRIAESVMESLPLTAGAQAGVRQGQQTAFNRAVLSRAGALGDAATPDVLQANRASIQGDFNRLSASTTINVDRQLLTDLADATQRYGTKLPSQQRPAFQAYVQDILGQGAAMPGTVYQQARSDLSRQARAARNTDPFFGQALRSVRDALDDAAGRSIAPADQAAWQQARTDWRYQRQIENAMAGAGVDAATGNIPAAQLRTAAIGGDRSGYARGDGALNDLARVGQAFLKPPPDSGTAGRSGMMQLMQGAPLFATAGGGAAMGGASLLAAAAAGGAALLGPRAVQALMNSDAGQAYLSRGIPGLAGTLPSAGAAGANAAVLDNPADRRRYARGGQVKPTPSLMVQLVEADTPDDAAAILAGSRGKTAGRIRDAMDAAGCDSVVALAMAARKHPPLLRVLLAPKPLRDPAPSRGLHIAALIRAAGKAKA